ncbi:MFS transporter [Nonomuraea glycinis]|uniref:Membrane protein n=1 Tax=Nonomuraea glycinis TaxID=2047744 RepID=A0A917ZYJ4_9ACTN|nr:MFS transporter [Nonomuraea glycinis]MCA2175029.1 MFS transporter [Nonomuraea glycinis]GGP01059.1 membrane protein [Nonomuraea glycinis]
MSTERGATYGEVFAVREFRVLFGSFALLVAGDSIKMLALSVLVYAQTGSPGLSAAAYMAGWLPYIAGGMFLLSLADRLPPRAVMVVGELVRVVVCMLLAYAGLPVWAMLALVLVTGLFSPVFGAARSALLPDVLPGDAFVLGRSLLGVTSAGAQVAGLAVGGAFLAVAGPHGALAATAGLSALAALLLRYGLPYRPARQGAPHIQNGSRTSGSGVGEVGGEGAVRATLRVNRLLVADRRVRGLLLASWLPPLCLAGAEAMIVPYLGGQGQAGIVLAAAACGMAVGEFAVGRFAAPALRERLSLPLAALLGIPWLGFLAAPGAGWAAAIAATAAAGLAYQLGLQRRFVDAVPEEVRGQAFGLLSTGLMTGQAIGAALIGVLGELFSPRLAIVAAGGAAILVALALSRALRPETVPSLEALGKKEVSRPDVGPA